MRVFVILSAIAIGISALVVLQGGGSEAAWPGDNGRVLYRDEVNGGIWIMDADGSDRQPVTTGNDYYPSWSPDASSIVFERQENMILGGMITTSIWTVDPDGTDLTQVAPGNTPSWSPDGTRIVYSSEGYIHEMNANGSDDVQITNNKDFWDTAPVYRPDGSVIAFLRQPFIALAGGLGISGGGPSNDIWTVDPVGLGGLQITNTPGVSEGTPDWSPAGDRLTHTDDSGLVVRTFPGNVPQTIVPELIGGFPDGPVFSPDGTTIAYTAVELIAPVGGSGDVGPAITPTKGTVNTVPAGGGAASPIPGGEDVPAEFYPDWEPETPPTPTPSPSPTPTPSPTPGPTPIVRDLVWGDDQCDDEANPIDSLITLRWDAGLAVLLNGCPPMNQDIILNSISPAGGLNDPQIWGDVDCGGVISPVDSLKILRYDAGLAVAQEAGCPLIGDSVNISYAP
ncbi:MAG TPA: hypothetical protein VIT93_01300 [Dehalococcoidia bacterium]